MRRLPLFFSLLILLFAFSAAAQMSNEDCLACHDDASLTKDVGGRSVSVHVDPAKYEASVHGMFGCSDCHTDISDYPHEPAAARVDCSSCHPDAVAAYDRSLHADSVAKRNPQAATCFSCHGGPHEILSSSDENSRTYRTHLPAVCGECHGVKFVMEKSGFSVQPFLNYQESVHGKLVAGGSMTAAVCTDCHNSHEVLSGRDPDSPIFKFNVPQTCGQCHGGVTKEFDESVHGRALARGNWSSPSCTDCHGIHLIKPHIDPTSSVSSQAVALTTCANCHEGVKLSEEFGIAGYRIRSYRDSYHGLAKRLGSDVAANCASCHGVHNIYPSSDPRSTIHASNIQATCGSCHPGATEKFVQGTVHLNISLADDIGSKVVRWVRWIYLGLIWGVIGGMILHNLIIWWRKASDARKAAGRNVVRMNRNQRIQHMLLVISFFVLVISGFALAYPDIQALAMITGGEAIRRIVHRAAGVVMIALGIYHVGYMLGTREGRRGLRDFMPNLKDARDVVQTMSYYLRLSNRKPQFGRFTYAEKAEYWALVWGTVIMGVTGLMLWFNVEFARFFARWWLDVATAVHYYEAILATLAIIVWHLYQVIFDPDVYPMNWAWYDGRMTEEQYEHEHALAYREWREQHPSEADETPEEERDEHA
jgi:formate dehydrogenase gamma subunit